MSHSFLARGPRLGLALAATVLASAAMATTASAGVTTFKQVNGKLTISAATGDLNKISLEFYSSSSFRVKDLGTGVSLSPGAGIGSTATYSPGDISFNTYAPVTSVRINAKDQNDTINTTLTALPTQLLAGAGNDTVTAGGADSTISGGAGNDILNGGAGNDTILSGSGDDFSYGNNGDDALFAAGDTGIDEADGGAGDDFATVDGAYDTIGAVESLIIGD